MHTLGNNDIQDSLPANVVPLDSVNKTNNKTNNTHKGGKHKKRNWKTSHKKRVTGAKQNDVLHNNMKVTYQDVKKLRQHETKADNFLMFSPQVLGVNPIVGEIGIQVIDLEYLQNKFRDSFDAKWMQNLIDTTKINIKTKHSIVKENIQGINERDINKGNEDFVEGNNTVGEHIWGEGNYHVENQQGREENYIIEEKVKGNETNNITEEMVEAGEENQKGYGQQKTDATQGTNSLVTEKLKIIDFLAANVQLPHVNVSKYRNGRSITTVCRTYKQEGKHFFHQSRRTFLDIFSTFNNYSKDDVTLVTQMSLQRMQILKIVAQYWDGPMSVALQVEPEDFIIMGDHFRNAQYLLERHNIDFHIVAAKGVS